MARKKEKEKERDIIIWKKIERDYLHAFDAIKKYEKEWLNRERKKIIHNWKTTTIKFKLNNGNCHFSLWFMLLACVFVSTNLNSNQNQFQKQKQINQKIKVFVN